MAEDTGIIVYPDGTFYVIGSDYVTLVKADNLKYSNYSRINNGERIVADGITVSYLYEGYGYSLRTRRIISPKITKEKILNNIKETESERFSGK